MIKKSPYSSFLVKTAIIGMVLLILPSITGAVSQGSVEKFHIESGNDFYSRNQVEAVLHRITNKVYIYIEKDWWEELKYEERAVLDDKLYQMSSEFEYNIYPKMTAVFGSKPSHPVDDSGKITVLFHRMSSGSGGYFRLGDQYSRYQYARSNEKNIIYINTGFMNSSLLNGFLAHEFMHMITFGVKEKKHNIQEDLWLNEARAEYMPAFMGYDVGENSNVARRINTFINNPNTSLTEWLNRESDYGVINMFVYYLVDHYGIEILADSLKSAKVGIESVNEALQKNGYKEDFNQIFVDWTIAVLVNDCSLGEKYCYKSEQLKDLKIVPVTQYLPSSYGGMYASRNSTKNWTGNWRRIVGGKGDLVFELEVEENLDFRVPYIFCTLENDCEVNFLTLKNGKGETTVKNFGEEYAAFYFLPSLQTKTTGFSGRENDYFFNWRATSIFENRETENEDEITIQILLNRIEELEKELVRLQNLAAKSSNYSCLIDSNLFFGARGVEVECLQEFLKNQGVYPEGLITGNFLTLTKQAVIRFQEKYAQEILHPLGLQRGTGYVGIKTREKINELQ